MSNIVITGANRGIGLALCKKYAELNHQVYAICRAPSQELISLKVNLIEDIDLTAAEANGKIKKALEKVPVDILINNAGIMINQTIDSFSKEDALKQFMVNSIAPVEVTLALRDNFQAGSKVAIITSRMGSISDNTSGGSYGYRMSKAAINAAGASLAHDLKEKNIAVALIHPGWVKTNMTNNSGQLTTEESVGGIVQRIEQLDLQSSGTFWHTNGEKLPW